jgi:hypothetical protein
MLVGEGPKPAPGESEIEIRQVFEAEDFVGGKA